MKNVLLVSNKVFHYRVSNYNFFAQRFKEEGWNFYVRANELQKNNPYDLDFDFEEVPFDFKAYKKEIEEIEPDVVILFLHLKNLIIWPLIHWLKWKGIPVVYWNKGVNLEVRNPWLRNQPFYYIHSRCDSIVLYSEKEIKDIKPKNQDKVFVANNTINFSAFPEIREDKETLKKEFGIPFKKVVLFVGRMRGVKKVDHLIQIFNEMDDPDAGAIIVGDPMDNDLESMIKKKNVMHLGEIFDPTNTEISKLFKLSDIFCIPGDVGLGLNQAFHWGLPVVTEDGLQPPEIHYLCEGENGFMVAENDLPALRERVELLLNDDALREKFSEHARKHIAEVASTERMFQGFMQCVSFLTQTETQKQSAENS